MALTTEKSLLQRTFPDLLAFGIGLGMAYYLKWDTTDLVWSLWLCSLVVGYLTILSAVGGGAYFGLYAIRHKDFKPSHRVPTILAGAAGGLFFLGFFSLHFGGFHAGHSVFLQMFFPVEGMPFDGFGRAFMNPPLLWVLVFRHLMNPYGLFLLPAIIAERKHVFRPLISAIRSVHRSETADDTVDQVVDGEGSEHRNPVGEAMGRPYINVMRMHLLIFFFAFCHLLKVDSFLVYVVVYAVYFFPWRELKRLKPKAATKPAQPLASELDSA